MHETEKNKDNNTLKPNANLTDATIFHLLVLGFVLGWLGLTLGWLALALVPRGYIRILPWPPLFPPFIELFFFFFLKLLFSLVTCKLAFGQFSLRTNSLIVSRNIC